MCRYKHKITKTSERGLICYKGLREIVSCVKPGPEMLQAIWITLWLKYLSETVECKTANKELCFHKELPIGDVILKSSSSNLL